MYCGISCTNIGNVLCHPFILFKELQKSASLLVFCLMHPLSLKSDAGRLLDNIWLNINVQLLCDHII